MVHTALVFLTKYSFPSLVSPTDKHFHTFLFAVHEYFWLVNVTMDSKMLGIALETIFEQILFSRKRKKIELLTKLRFIRESTHVDSKAPERHGKCMRTKQTAFKKKGQGRDALSSIPG